MAQASETLIVQGVEIPRIGLGTSGLDGAEARDAAVDAIEIGYRHIDTARAYGNESDLGAGIAASGVGRDELFVTTKLWHDELHAAGVREQAEGSLRDLGLDHVDLLLIHWPTSTGVPVEETLAEMERLQGEGKATNLGVSNFPTVELGEAREATSVPLIADQVEYHAFLDQSKLLRMLREHDMALTSYGPLGSGDVADSDELAEIGRAHGKSAIQVGLRWLVQQDNVLAIPRSASHENRADNLDVFDFELGPEEVERIDALPKDHRHFDPGFAAAWD